MVSLARTLVVAVTLAYLGSTTVTAAPFTCPDNPAQLGFAKYCHTPFHEAYKRMFREINAAWIEQNVPSEEVFDQLYERHMRGSVHFAEAKGPGDYGFMKGRPEFNELYRKMYVNTKCHCEYGACRPTKVRVIEPGEQSESGFMVYADGAWHPVPNSVILQENQVSVGLWEELMSKLKGHQELNGHICMTTSGKIECVFIPRFAG